MQVLLTGATGLIGRQVAGELAASGREVIALARRPVDVPGVSRTVIADLMDPVATEAALKAARADELVHLAWYDGPGRMAARDNLDWSSATIRLVSSFSYLCGRRIVAAGSCAEYDWTLGVPLSEAVPLKPASLYGIAKARTGALLTEVAPRIDLSLVWARIFFVYGPNEPRGRLLGDLIHGLRAGETVKCSDGTQVRDFLHARDVARALVALLDSTATGPVNVASGHGTAVGDIISGIASRLNGEKNIEMGAIARPADDPDRLVGEASKLAELTGFRPRFDLERGLDDILAAKDAGPPHAR